MIDDNLELPTSPPPTPAPGAVLLTGVLDGDGRARLLITGDDGATCYLPADPPEAVAPPAQRLVTPGFHGPTVPRFLVSGRPEAAMLAPVDRVAPAGAVVEAQWRQRQAGSPDWAEVAIVAGADVTIGSFMARVVAHGDAKPTMLGTGTVAALLTVTAPIPRGVPLWLVLVASGGTMPDVIASAFPDPIASGGSAVGVDGWRPSQDPGPIGFNAQNAPAPFCAVVRVP